MRCNHTCRVCGKQETGGWVDATATELQSKLLCFNCNFWEEKVYHRDNPRVVRIDGSHYWIGEEDDPPQFRGFGGSRFTVQFNDGREVVTTNLWGQGTIPEHYREQLPDNARFVGRA